MKNMIRLATFIAAIAAGGMLNARLQAQSALANGLVAYYPLSGTAHDVSGNGLNAIAQGGVTLVSDRLGNKNSACQFDGTTGFLNINDPNGKLNFDARYQNYSVTLWFLLNTTSADQKFICDRYNNSPCSYDIYYSRSLNKFIVDIWDGGSGSLSLTSDIVSRPHIWHQIAFVVSNRFCHLYLDGMENDRGGSVLGENVGTTKNSDGVCQIGSDGIFCTTRLHGSENDIRIYNRALSSGEISELFAYESKPMNLRQDVTLSPAAENIDPVTQLPLLVDTPPPTNMMFDLGGKVGQLQIVGNGIILESTNYEFLSQIHITSLSEDQSFELLENKTVYEVLTGFGKSQNRTVESENYELQMKKIWLSQPSLNDKIQSRLTILKEMKDYNTAASDYRSKAGITSGVTKAANEAQQNASIESAVRDVNNAVAHTRYNSYDNEERGIVYDARRQQGSFNARADSASASALATANLASEMQYNVQKDFIACQLHSAHLAAWGIIVLSSPPFDYIPSLSMKREIDAERTSRR